jgi:hypothetical protein
MAQPHATKENPMNARRISPATVIASIALFVSLSGTAVAAGLITGKNVLDGSLTAVDIRDNSLGTREIENGSLRPVDFEVLPAGPQGPAGPSGPQGAKGAQGKQGVPGAPGLSGVEVVTLESIANSSGDKLTEVVCPDGKVAIGGGGETVVKGVNYGYMAALVASAPTDDQHGWFVRAKYSPGGQYGAWALRVYAVCANVTQPPPEAIGPTADVGLSGAAN